MKKVFSKEKYDQLIRSDFYLIDKNKIDELIEEIGWINICDGLTEEEMNKLGYLTHKDWMVEVEE